MGFLTVEHMTRDEFNKERGVLLRLAWLMVLLAILCLVVMPIFPDAAGLKAFLMVLHFFLFIPIMICFFDASNMKKRLRAGLIVIKND